jgi:hypothetical protein
LARDSKTLEQLLRAEVAWDTPAYLAALQALVEHWSALSGGMALDVLPMGRNHRAAPL